MVVSGRATRDETATCIPGDGARLRSGKEHGLHFGHNKYRHACLKAAMEVSEDDESLLRYDSQLSCNLVVASSLLVSGSVACHPLS